MDIGQFNFQEIETRVSIPPVWVDGAYKSEKGCLQWFSKNQPILERLHENRIRRMNNNLCWYLNEIGTAGQARMILGNRQIAPIGGEMLQVLVGHLYDLTEQRVSRLSTYKPAFDVAPTHNEESDRITARLMKPVLDAIARNNNLDFLVQDIQRWASIFGEVFCSVDWNKNLGDKDEKGNPIGDVEIKIKDPYFVFYAPNRNWKDVPFFTEVHEILHIEEARAKYKIPSLQTDNTSTVYSFSPDYEAMKAGDEIVIYRVVYKPSEYLPNGLIFKVAGKQILELEYENYAWSHNKLPYVRHTDIDVPGRVFPISYYNYLIPLQHTYNKLTALINRNISLTAHPKWMAQKGSVDMKALGNTASIALYNPGAPKPELAVFNSVPQDVFNFRSDMRSEMQTISGVQGVSRGSPPPGARAASMLKFYEEQEVQRSSTQIMKHNEMIRDIVTMAGGIVGDRYPEAPERLIRTVGKSNRYKIMRLTEVKISSNYDIIIQNSTGFSESKSGRIEEIGFIQQNVPGLLKPQQIADILEIAQPQKAYDIMTSALNRAEEENSDFMDGMVVGAPEVSDDHFTHWDTHVIFMQSETFRRLPKRYKDNFIQHVKIHEKYMEDMGMKSPLMQQQLDALPNYPIFWVKDPMAMPPQAPQAPAPMPDMSGQPPMGAVPAPMGIPEMPPAQGSAGFQGA